MRVVCVGGGPGGLFAATLLRRARPDAEVTVLERNEPGATFGFGVVFSDATLGLLADADPVLVDTLRTDGVRWDDIELDLHGRHIHCGGNGMSAVARATLLSRLQDNARSVGVDLRTGVEVGPAKLPAADVVLAADGASSSLRQAHEADFGPTVATATAKFIWLGTTAPFTGLTFVHRRGPHGVLAAHAYPIGDGRSTFIVETDEATWRAAGLDGFDLTQPPGRSDERSRAYLEHVFADALAGQRLLTNNSRWGNFRTLRTACWRTDNIVLLGDAAHTAHFSVGSGTKMAMEDAVVLADALSTVDGPGDVSAALAKYEEVRRPQVAKIQDSARPSLSWWEHFGRYHDTLEPTQFAFHFLSRSIGRERLARRDPGFVASVDDWWAGIHGAPPLDSPMDVAGVRFPGRRTTTRREPDGSCTVSSGGVSLRLPSTAAIEAPDTEAGLPAALDDLARAVREGAPAVLVHGGGALPRTLLCEQARLVHRTPSVLAMSIVDDDEAITTVLSGRADLVSVP